MEEKKEKKTIKCSYAILVIILFAALAFVTDYAFIERKTSKCDCPKCEATNNEVISGDIENKDNTDDTQVIEDGSNKYNEFADKIISERKTFFEGEFLYRTTVDGNNMIDVKYYNVELNPEGELKVIYYSNDNSSDSKFIANDVLNYYIIYYGNGGYKGLYFIYKDGSVGFANIEQAYMNKEDITIKNIENVKNIITIVQGSFSDGMSGYHAPIYIDIDGNMIK